jgi:hypothetical protein
VGWPLVGRSYQVSRNLSVRSLLGEEDVDEGTDTIRTMNLFSLQNKENRVKKDKEMKKEEHKTERHNMS